MTNVRMRDIPLLDRPIERMKHIGTEALSNEEIFAILLKTGTSKVSAKGVASLLLKEIGNLQNITNISFESLNKIHGIGEKKAATILAALELSKRLKQEVNTIKGMQFRNAELVFSYYRDRFEHKKQEVFYAVYLDEAKRIISDKLLFMGTLGTSPVHPREIFKEALLLDASAIICVHNHPSGNVYPSHADKRVTEKLIELGLLFGIPIIDHIIVGKRKFYSFYENHDIA